MKILTTKADVDNLRELRQRKAELKARLVAEQAGIRETWQTVRTDFEPSRLVGTVAKSLLGISDKSATATDQSALGMAAGLQGPLKMATDLFVRDPRIALLLKFVAPLAVAYWPHIIRKAKKITPTKAGMYGSLRKGVAGLRKQIRRKKSDTPPTVGTEDIIQPS